MAMLKTFSQVLQELAQERGLKQREIAERTGISESYVSQMIVLGRVPQWGMLNRLADGLALSRSERLRLFTAAGYPSSETETDSKGDPLPEPVREVAEMMRPLSPTQLRAVKGLLASFRGGEENERRRGQSTVRPRQLAA